MIDRHAPLRLKTAAELAFPLGGMTASGLRKEAARGNLSGNRPRFVPGWTICKYCANTHIGSYA